ncbi:phage head-tail connector protein [bacterium]|jgi:hypothetical protein|nr:phage head-tail connector protein [bacterium]
MAYTTLALVKSSLGIPDAVTSEDTAITAAIGAADALIDNYTGRTFEVAATSVRTYVPRTASILDVDDIATATGLVVKVDNDQDGTYETTLTVTTDYVLDGNDEPYRMLTNVNNGWPLSIYGRPTIEVTAKFAYSETPPDNIKQAALLMSCRLYQRKASPLGFQAGAVPEFGAVRISRNDPDVAALLQGVKLLGVA